MFYKALPALLFLGIATAHAQSVPLYQAGAITPGHAGAFAINGILQDAGDSNGTMPAGGQGGLSALNVRNAVGTPFCVNDNPISSSAGYHQLCLGADTTVGGVTGGFLTYNAYGPAAPLPLTLNVNGTNYPVAAPIVTAYSFGAACDVVSEEQDASMTSGSAVLTSGSYSFPATAVGKRIVVAGAGTQPFYALSKNETITAGGTGYAINDQSTMSDGTVVEVTGQSGGIVSSIAIMTAHPDATHPTQPLTQSSSTGSGTGLQLTLQYVGAPLYGKILSISGKTATLSVAASNGVGSGWGAGAQATNWYYGTDDSAALQAGLNAVAPGGANPGALLIPGKCGTTVQLELPAVSGQNGFNQEGGVVGQQAGLSAIYALAPVTAVLHRASAFELYGGARQLLLECGELATYGLYLEGGSNATYQDLVAADCGNAASSSAFYRIGNGTNTLTGTAFLHISSRIDPNSYSQGQMANYGAWINANATDDHFVHMQPMYGGSIAGIEMDAASDVVGDFHISAPVPPDFCSQYGVKMTGIGDAAEVLSHIDCATVAGISIGGNEERVAGVYMNNFFNLPNAIGVSIANAKDFVSVTGVRTNATAMQGTNLVVQSGSSGANTCVQGNPGASYTHVGTGC